MKRVPSEIDDQGPYHRADKDTSASIVAFSSHQGGKPHDPENKDGWRRQSDLAGQIFAEISRCPFIDDPAPGELVDEGIPVVAPVPKYDWRKQKECNGTAEPWPRRQQPSSHFRNDYQPDENTQPEKPSRVLRKQCRSGGGPDREPP